jgi:hypothetical protein
MISIRYEGPAISVPSLASMLEEEGYAVDFTTPTYQSVGDYEPDDTATAALFVTGNGTGRSVAAVVGEFRRRLSADAVGIEVIVSP